jgi:hypothetical protein
MIVLRHLAGKHLAQSLRPGPHDPASLLGKLPGCGADDGDRGTLGVRSSWKAIGSAAAPIKARKDANPVEIARYGIRSALSDWVMTKILAPHRCDITRPSPR